ncbi:MAG: hypothetical protein OCU20_09730 [Methanophagales archaeon]|nr:hypothetical protein [Methanophagales archaeon]
MNRASPTGCPAISLRSGVDRAFKGCAQVKTEILIYLKKQKRREKNKKMKLKKMFAVIVLVAIISVSFAGYHHFFGGKEQFEGDSSPPIVSNASLANVSILLKLEGVSVKIASDMNESAVCSLLQKELKADVNPVGEGVYEIRKNITEEHLTEVLKKINASIAEEIDDEPFFKEGITPQTRNETWQIIKTKLNMLGLENFTVRTSGEKLLHINITGVDAQDVQIVKDIIGVPGKFEIRIQTGGKGGDINAGQRLEDIENITAHVIYASEGIESAGTIPVRVGGDSLWGVPFSLKKEAAAKLRDDAEKYGALDNPMDHEIAMLLDDVVIYSAPLSPELANEMKTKKIENLVVETGLGEEGFKKAKELIIHLRAGTMPVNVKLVRFVEHLTS